MKLLLALVACAAADQLQNHGQMDVAKPTTLTFTDVSDLSKCHVTKKGTKLEGTCDFGVEGGKSIAANAADIVTANGEITRLDGEISANDGDIKQLQDDLAAALGRIDTLESENTDRKTEIGTLNEFMTLQGQTNTDLRELIALEDGKLDSALTTLEYALGNLTETQQTDYSELKDLHTTDAQALTDKNALLVAEDERLADLIATIELTPGAKGQMGHKGQWGIDGVKGAQGERGHKGWKGEHGHKGDRGYKGDQGIQGIQGHKGDQGAQGIQGHKGDQGVQGIQGHKGDQGAQGIQGHKGDQGAQGEEGAAGKDGTNGTNGTNGAKGATGEKGADGTNGTNGAKGATGEKGADGDHGTNGAKGATGEKGADGTNGTNGAKGATGEKGTDGTNGTKGQTGETGTPGTNGTNGQNGEDGAKGETGSAGKDGENGTNGTNGTNGEDGAPGAKGEKGADAPTTTTPAPVADAIGCHVWDHVAGPTIDLPTNPAMVPAAYKGWWKIATSEDSPLDDTKVLYIEDFNPVWGAGATNQWKTSGTVKCQSAFSAGWVGPFGNTDDSGTSCDRRAVGNHECGTKNGWMLLHSGATYDVDGQHPCKVVGATTNDDGSGEGDLTGALTHLFRCVS